jgi:hypothetical protein
LRSFTTGALPERSILWHVEDLKISHVDCKVSTDIIKIINDKFGKEAPLTMVRGHIHVYLGMTLNYMEKGKVKIKMLVEKCLLISLAK